MIVEQESLAAAARGFVKWIEAETLLLKDFAFRKIAGEPIKSTGASNTYGWAELLGGMTEWVGDRTADAVKAHAITVANKDWQRSIPISKNAIEDDALGVYKPAIQSLGFALERHYDELAFGLLLAGFTTDAYDGKKFFATNHSFGSNKGTAALDATTFDAAFKAMMKLKNDDGVPLGISPSLLVCGPDSRSAAHVVLKAQFLTSGASNTNYQAVDLLVVPWITGPQWFLLDTSKPVMPVLVQERSKTPPRWIVQPGELKPQGLYGFDARYAAALALPQLAYGSTGGA